MQTNSQLPETLLDNTRQKQTDSRASLSTSGRDSQPELRSVVASRVMRMLRGHDRARDQLLAPPPTQPR